MSKETELAIRNKLAEYKVFYKTHYIGEGEDDFVGDKPWRHDKWVTTFTLGKKVISVDFRMGLGNRGKKFPNIDKPLSPTPASVLYSCLSDATAKDATHAQWCGDFGYDADSIKGLKIYEACIEIGKKLDIVFTPSQQAELRELLQDY